MRNYFARNGKVNVNRVRRKLRSDGIVYGAVFILLAIAYSLRGRYYAIISGFGVEWLSVAYLWFRGIAVALLGETALVYQLAFSGFYVNLIISLCFFAASAAITVVLFRQGFVIYGVSGQAARSVRADCICGAKNYLLFSRIIS